MNIGRFLLKNEAIIRKWYENGRLGSDMSDQHIMFIISDLIDVSLSKNSCTYGGNEFRELVNWKHRIRRCIESYEACDEVIDAFIIVMNRIYDDECRNIELISA